MPLPKTKHPLFETTLPSNGRMISYRQMLVSDEKILLMAKSSEDDNDIYRAVKQVVNNCIIGEVEELTTFDIEWLFLQIRSTSIGNLIELAFVDKEDEQEYKFAVDLDDVVINWPRQFEEGEGALITVGDNTAIKMRYPPSGLYDDKQATGPDAYEYIAARCIDTIFDGDDIYSSEDSSIEELVEYVHNLDVKTYKIVKDFIASTPHLNYVLEYTNSKGTERKLALTTLTDFFTLR